MNNLPREMLCRILAKYGKEIASDARRCENLLNDLCGSYKREINVLVNAIEERVPLDLLAGTAAMPPELLLSRLEKRLEEQTALTADAARWAVESWALALGIVTNVELESRKKNQAIAPETKAATEIQPPEFENKTTKQGSSNINRANSALPPKVQPPTPRSKITLPSNSPSAKIPPAAPPARLPANNQPPVHAPAANPPYVPPNPVAVSRNGFGIFRGCLLVVFLLAIASIVLFFGVPYAIEVMRETQRERNNEPPRFPTTR